MAGTLHNAILPPMRALLAGVIDYAGIFPPAALPLEESIRNYARYLQEPEAWMLGRFICPAARLAELVPFVRELFVEGEPLRISALGRGGADDFEQALDADLDSIAAFRSETGRRAVVDVLETRAPDPAAEAAGRCARAMEQRSHAAGLRPFLEISLAADWRANLPRIATSLAGHRVGFKLRTGGVEGSAFPSSEQLAAVIVACRDADCAMKFTAGLHHPIRHYNEGMKVKMHGFLNVFVAAALARARHFDTQQLREVLEAEDPCCLRFRDYGLSFGELAISTDQITAAREFATSFGSCSFDEPRDDLRALKLL